MTKMVQDLMVAVEQVRDAFHRALYVDRDGVAATAVTGADVVMTNLPMTTGAQGRDALAAYLERDLVAHLPGDLAFQRISRTVDRWHVVDETLVSFTHDRELPWLLPRLAPTNRPVEVLAISVVTVQRSLISTHRTLWDHWTLLTQLGQELPAPQRK